MGRTGLGLKAVVTVRLAEISQEIGDKCSGRARGGRREGGPGRQVKRRSTLTEPLRGIPFLSSQAGKGGFILLLTDKETEAQEG